MKNEKWRNMNMWKYENVKISKNTKKNANNNNNIQIRSYFNKNDVFNW